MIAIVSSLLEVAGDLLETDTSLSDDAIPVIYNVLFIPINGYYVMRYLLNREAIPFTEEEEALYTRCFAPLGFARGQFSRLVSAGSFEKVEEPTTLCTQVGGWVGGWVGHDLMGIALNPPHRATTLVCHPGTTPTHHLTILTILTVLTIPSTHPTPHRLNACRVSLSRSSLLRSTEPSTSWSVVWWLHESLPTR